MVPLTLPVDCLCQWLQIEALFLWHTLRNVIEKGKTAWNRVLQYMWLLLWGFGRNFEYQWGGTSTIKSCILTCPKRWHKSMVYLGHFLKTLNLQYLQSGQNGSKLGNEGPKLRKEGPQIGKDGPRTELGETLPRVWREGSCACAGTLFARSVLSLPVWSSLCPWKLEMWDKGFFVCPWNISLNQKLPEIGEITGQERKKWGQIWRQIVLTSCSS